MKKSHPAYEITKFIDKFTKINSLKDIPVGVNLTIALGLGTEDRGFVENVKVGELGIMLLIAKSYILQSELDKLFNQKKP